MKKSPTPLMAKANFGWPAPKFGEGQGENFVTCEVRTPNWTPQGGAIFDWALSPKKRGHPIVNPLHCQPHVYPFQARAEQSARALYILSL